MTENILVIIVYISDNYDITLDSTIGINIILFTSSIGLVWLLYIKKLKRF